MQKIRIGPAGTGGDSLKGMEKVNELGLNSCEIEFVYGVKMSNSLAKKVGEAAKKNNIKLSVHAPYWINLASKEKKKIEESKKRILDSAERGHYLNASYIVFHPGFYGNQDKKLVYEIIKEAIIDIQKIIKKNKWKVKLAPEITGKINVFGSIDEILKLVKETDCSFCLDLAHIKARQYGKINYDEIFDKFKNFKHIHCHFSGINYTRKGERNHLITKESEILELAKEVIKRKLNITIINESPDPPGDSLKTKRIFEKLGYKFKYKE